MKYLNILEEELKNKVARDYFGAFDCTEIKGKVDFCVALKNKKESQNRLDIESILWAEAKKGKSDLIKSIVQLILTIGKARTFDTNLPPAFLGAFDAEKIAFISYSEILDILSLNDFNWNVTPSNYETKEFKLIYNKVESLFDNDSLTFLFGNDDEEIKEFVKANFILGKSDTSKIRIDKNNFIVVFNKWLRIVQPTISFSWEAAKPNIISGDFYLADLLSRGNVSLKESLYVVLNETNYEMNKYQDMYGAFNSSTVGFNDGQKAHAKFWNKYEHPPDQEYWDYILARRDLLVPQDIRERKGSFFTPQPWVELSQKYLADVLGEDWQDEFYVWDCASGTGNLLNGLTNKYNIWASTLDKQDVEVMKDRILHGTNLLEEHVFQFDFLNDDFKKLPQPLQNIINDPEKRKKLVIYINPPYAEGDTVAEKELTRKGVATSKTYTEFYELLGKARGELFAQFFMRIYKNIPDAKLASFSTLKYINSENFSKFRNVFEAKFEKGFVVLANTFDNVIGKFPIGFTIWDLSVQEKIERIDCDIIDSDSGILGTKIFCNYDGQIRFLNDWLKQFNDKSSSIGKLGFVGNDFQNQKLVFITRNGRGHHETNISQKNLIPICIYFAVRHVLEHNWLNHNDQFLFPNDKWKDDVDFQNNCIAFALFHEKNRMALNGPNHWIPFTENEVNTKEKFESNFMTQFIQGKLKEDTKEDLFGSQKARKTALVFSAEAIEVFNAGRELWKYYHRQPKCNVNASLYDIREYFQGRNAAGKMNNKSKNENYMLLINDLREKLKTLAKKIEPKIYKYGFLK